MTKEKQLYVSPETETLVIRFEGGILTGSLLYGNPGYNPNYGSGSIDDQGDF